MGIRSATLFFALVMIGMCRSTLPDPFSLYYENLEPPSLVTSWYPGYASKGEMGYFFGLNLYNGPNLNIGFNFSAGATTKIFPELPVTQLDYPCVTLIPNGDIYLIGGMFRYEDGSGFSANSTVFKLAAGSESYTLMAPMPNARFFHTCTYDESTNRIYVFGGSLTQFGGLTPLAEYYSIDDNTWTAVGNKSNPGGSAINIGDGHMYFFNGFYSTDVWRYTIADDSWTKIGATNNINGNPVYDERENIIFLFGGPSMSIGCEYFNLTSNTAVLFPCNNSLDLNLNTFDKYSAYVPATNTFYMFSYEKLFKATFTRIEPPATPESSPESTNAPTTSGSPSSTPSSSNSPSKTTPLSSITSSSARTLNAWGILSVFIAALWH